MQPCPTEIRRADGPIPSVRTQPLWSLRDLDAHLTGFPLVIGVFSLGNSSNAFLILKDEHVGVSPAWISGLYLAFNATYALLSVPSGILADRFGSKKMILCGFAMFALVYAGFALATSV